MGTRVLHRGRVATTDFTAREAQPQVHPWGSEPEALLTAFERVWLYRPHERKMRVGSDRAWNGRHGSYPPSLSVSQDRQFEQTTTLGLSTVVLMPPPPSAREPAQR